MSIVSVIHINDMAIILDVNWLYRGSKNIKPSEGLLMRLRVFFTVLISDLLTVMLSMVYAVFLAWLIERVIPLGGVYYWLVLGTIFIFLLLVDFYYCSPSYIDVSIGRDLKPERDSAWVAYFGVFIGSLFMTTIIVLQVDQEFSLKGTISFVFSIAVFILVFICFFIYIRRLRRKN